MTDLSDDAKRNREGWTKANADYTDEQARRAAAARVRPGRKSRSAVVGDVAGP